MSVAGHGSYQMASTYGHKLRGQACLMCKMFLSCHGVMQQGMHDSQSTFDAQDALLRDRVTSC